MSDDFGKRDPKIKLPLASLSSKPVHLMTDEELSQYRKELSLLRPLRSEISDIYFKGQKSQPETNHYLKSPNQQILLKNTNEEIEPYSFFLFYFFVLPIIIGLIFVLPLLLLLYL